MDYSPWGSQRVGHDWVTLCMWSPFSRKHPRLGNLSGDLCGPLSARFRPDWNEDTLMMRLIRRACFKGAEWADAWVFTIVRPHQRNTSVLWYKLSCWWSGFSEMDYIFKLHLCLLLTPKSLFLISPSWMAPGGAWPSLSKHHSPGWV